MSEEATGRRPSQDLTSKQRKHLRGLAHHLDPVVLIGGAGVSDAIVAKVRTELDNHELIKVRFSDSSPMNAREGGAPLADAAGAHLAQVIGRIAILYRRREKKPEITLP